MIGVFDSGVGGLSVLRHVRAALPAEDLVYFSDAGFAPYGDKPEAVIVERALAIAAFLRQAGATALVVACNTATAAAIEAIRTLYPSLVTVGVEPGLKPAAALSAARTVGVLATAATLASRRFAQLHAEIAAASGVRFLLQPCPGLADQVETGALDAGATVRLVERFVHPLLAQGADTLVLGCTHYPFVQPLIVTAALRYRVAAGLAPSPAVQLVDTGVAVARQLGAVLRQNGALHSPGVPGRLTAVTTGSCSTLAQAFQRLLSLDVPVADVRLAGPVAVPLSR